MIGARTPVSGEGETRFVFNGSVFAEVSGSLTLGLELSFRADVSRTDKTEIVPQVHWAITNHFGIQAYRTYDHTPGPGLPRRTELAVHWVGTVTATC